MFTGTEPVDPPPQIYTGSGVRLNTYNEDKLQACCAVWSSCNTVANHTGDPGSNPGQAVRRKSVRVSEVNFISRLVCIFHHFKYEKIGIF